MGHPRSSSILVAFALLASACAHGNGPVAVSAPTAPQVEGPAPGVIAIADAHLNTGISELNAGHLSKAREEFDRAVDAYLTAPGGAYAEPANAEAYRRTLETIHLHELEALAAGDGFTETPPEPASIDELRELEMGAPTEAARKTAEAVVKEEVNDLPVELNDEVLACIDLYQNKLRDWFSAALARGGRYLPHIREVFAAEGIPQDLAYVAMVESAFRTAALSRAKARGVWQFIPDTGRRYGLQQDWWVDERSNPEKATHAAASYLKELHTMFGDWNLALAAYNSGEGLVQRAIQRYKTQDFWELRRTRALPAETKNYVPLIHAAIVVAKAPAKYGFDVTPEMPSVAENVPVKGAVDLRVIAECTGSNVDEIQQLNPELRRLATPANRTFALRVPVGKGDALTHCLDALPAEKRVQFRTHVVAHGQTLTTLARRYGTRVDDIAAANGLAAGRQLSQGLELIIPVDPRVVPAATSVRAPEPPRPVAAVTRTAAARISYRVRSGDTLGRIAARFRTTVQALAQWNGLHDTRITAGNVLTIYTDRN